VTCASSSATSRGSATDPGTVDDHWTSATTDAVVDFQNDRTSNAERDDRALQVVITTAPRGRPAQREVGDAPAPARR